MHYDVFVDAVKHDEAFANFRNMLRHQPLLDFVYREKCILGPLSETRIFYNPLTQTEGGIAHSTQMVLDDCYGVFTPFKMTGVWIPLTDGNHYTILADVQQSSLIRQRNGHDECLFFIHPSAMELYHEVLARYRDQCITVSALSLSSPRSLLIAMPSASGDFEPVMVKVSLNQESHGVLRLLSERECALSVANTSIFKRRLAEDNTLKLDIFEDVFAFVPKTPHNYDFGMSQRLLPACLSAKGALIEQEHVVPLLAFYGQANADFFKSVVQANGNCATDFLKQFFQLYIHAFVSLLLDKQLSMEAHGQNLLLVFDQAWRLKRIMYRDMGGVNTPIENSDTQLPESLRDEALSYFKNHLKDAANAIEHHFVWRGLYPLTKQLVKHAEHFRTTDEAFDQWYTACLAMDPYTQVLGNWTDGDPRSDLHQERMPVTAFCRYGYVETLFGEMLVDYLESNEVLGQTSLGALRHHLFNSEQISEQMFVAPCTYKTFFDETITQLLSPHDLQLMNRSVLK